MKPSRPTDCLLQHLSSVRMALSCLRLVSCQPSRYMRLEYVGRVRNAAFNARYFLRQWRRENGFDAGGVR